MTVYCVIGAGAAGMSALVQLTQAGYDVDCFEKSDRVGGHWNTDYDALHLITSRDMTGFEGFPMPTDYPYFPRRDQVRDYLGSYAREHGLYEKVRFGVEVGPASARRTTAPTALSPSSTTSKEARTSVPPDSSSSCTGSAGPPARMEPLS